MIQRKCLVWVIWVVVACLCAAPGFAAQKPAPGSSGSEPDAWVLLMSMANFLAGAQQFSLKMNTGYDVVQKSGQKIEFGDSRRVTVVRPDRMRVDTERCDGEKTLTLFDGKEITVASPGQKVYAQTSVPGDVDNALFYLLSDLKLQLPLAMMYLTTLPLELKIRVNSVDLVEESAIMDVPCAHLAVRSKEVDFQVWIPTKGDPLPRRFVISYKNAPGQPQFWANLSDWNLSPIAPDGFFTFFPPDGFQRIAFLAQLDVAKPHVTKVKKGGKK